MELVYFSNEFPKDDLQDVFRRLHNKSKGRDHPTLTRFLDEATWAVKDEIRQLPTELKQSFPPFTQLSSWVENTELRGGHLCGAVDGVLLILVQLASYIGYVEEHFEEMQDAESTSLAGLGIGLLSTTAVSLSSDLVGLPAAASAAIRLAFRMGVHVQAVSDHLEARDLSESPDTWAYVVHNIEPAAAQQQLDDVQAGTDIPDTGKIFISAVSRNSVTISGPPAKLRALLNKSDIFNGSKLIPLPVFSGLCHAPHIYSSSDTDAIVHSRPLEILSRKSTPLPIYSTSTGLPYPAENPSELYESIVSELLMHAICWDKVVQGFDEHVRSKPSSKLSLKCFGSSMPLHDLKTALSVDSASEISTNNILTWLFEDAQTDSPAGSTGQSKLAIVGMSCRLPGGATDTEKFWELLEQGLDVSRKIPADRFDLETHFDPTGKEMNKTATQYGCFIDEPGMFDAPFFNMSPREAQVIDPQMRLSLVTAYEALERSGYVENRTAATQLQRIGTWYGQAADDYREVNQGQEVSTYYIPGGCRAFGPGRINYFFKFSGPSYSVDTACSSGLASIEVACQALWNGEVDTAVAGGVNVLTNPDGFAGLGAGYFLTKGHNACKTWDAGADGYCRADGVGSVVIKRLDDAQADNDNILGVILGAGTNHSAEAVSITHPHAGHQAYLSRQVLRQSGVDPLNVSYVELHGTGTQAGDYEEMQGIVDVYAPSGKGRSKQQPLHVGAVKSNVGHSESAAGTTALIKVLLMLQKNAIPPHVGIKTEINPSLPDDLDQRNVHVPFKMTPWEAARGKKRLATVNNFGAAGGNTTMILEDAPVREIVESDPRPVHIVAISAKTKFSLTGNTERLIAFLDAHPETQLADLSYTTTARRHHHNFRLAMASSDVDHLKKQLTGSLEKIDFAQPVIKGEPPPVAFSFTGQGASHKSMDLELYRDMPTFRRTVQHLDSLGKAQGFPSFIPAVDGSFDKDHQHSPVVTQLALVCTEIALAKYWASLGVKPDIVVGHSLGEYAAMHVAGVITAQEAVWMVGKRAQMLEGRCQTGSHIMMAVRASVSQIDENSDGKPYTIACINGPLDTVLSGTKEQMDDIAKPLGAAGYRCIKLDVAFAFHSKQTDPILDDFEAVAKTGVIFQEPKLPVISPLLGKVVYDDKSLNASYVRRATRETVDFLAALNTAQETAAVSEETIWVEIGPHPVSIAFVKSCAPSTTFTVSSIRRGEDNLKTVAESLAILHLAGVQVSWNEFHRPYESRLRLLDLPTYAWNEKNHWLQYKGDWCLTKGNEFYTKSSKATTSSQPAQASEIQTSTAQHIVDASFDGFAGSVIVQSDLMHPDFLAAARGHSMNGCGVVTSSIHADVAYTLAGYLQRKLNPQSEKTNMDIAELVVTKGLVAQSSSNKAPQLIRITAATSDIREGSVNMTWESVDNDSNACEQFATAVVRYGDPATWLSSWAPMAHLVKARIGELEHLAAEGKANRFSRNMAYTLFATNLVDYADKYRGMQSVVIHELEAFADVQLSVKEVGTWTVPPYFIDSVAHLAGFIMNCSDAMDTRNVFCVTPGWKSMQFAKPLTSGASYRSYVKMIPTAGDPAIYLGDVYILQDGEVIGLVGGIKFCRYPRVLLSRFFSLPDKAAASTGKQSTPAPAKQPPQEPAKPSITAPAPTAAESVASDTPSRHDSHEPSPTRAKGDSKESKESCGGAASGAGSSTSARAMELIAAEAGVEQSSLKADSSFADLGVDSLLSLVISEKLNSELDVNVGGSLFLDYPKIGDLCTMLDEYHS